jgi:alkanesulfonate monooxygenase SsuD/methylene tetrahydromethanopterin reductase-like flavin-dependent oxidoreductase (luciferase family)
LQLDTNAEKWNESLDIILKAFEGKPFSYDGKLFKIPETSIFPKPVQKPRPPIWVTGQSPFSIEAAAKRGLNVLTGGFGVSVERLREFGQIFNKVVADNKLATKPLVGVQRAVYVTKDDADARDAAEHARWNMRVTLSLRNNYEKVEKGNAIPVPAKSEPTIDELLENYLVIGTPETCIRQIKRLQQAVGISHFNCSFWIGDLDQKRVLKSMELFSKEVMPAFH